MPDQDHHRAKTPHHEDGSGGPSDVAVLRSSVTAPRDGIMTDDVGMITGELELETRCADGEVTAWLRYAGADEWYRLSRADCHLYDGRDHAALHAVVATVLHCSTPRLSG
jgi:hypothetical protein